MLFLHDCVAPLLQGELVVGWACGDGIDHILMPPAVFAKPGMSVCLS